jgi:hypothetical protein
MKYTCENQYVDSQDPRPYQRCFRSGEICVFALHETQPMCEDYRELKESDLEVKTEGQMFVGSRI